jgi:RimJ/RimL family protein N-acetyltransferase
MLEIETQRLMLRPFEVSDAEAAFGWLGDPVVMRFTPAGADKSTEETKARLAGYPIRVEFQLPTEALHASRLKPRRFYGQPA